MDEKISELDPVPSPVLPSDEFPLRRGDANFKAGGPGIAGSALGLITAMSGAFIQ